MDNAFLAITSAEKATLLLEVVKQAEKQSGNKDDWVSKAVTALTSAAKPEALLDVCWLHWPLVSAVDSDQKSKLGTLLFALQTPLRNTITFEDRQACWDKIAETAEACMTAAFNKSSAREILILLGPLIAPAKVCHTDHDWPSHVAKVLASKGGPEGLRHVCKLLIPLCFHAKSESGSESAIDDVVLLVRAIEDLFPKPAPPNVAGIPSK